MSSRLMQRVRTESGFAYGATSTWTAPRKSDGILALVTNSRTATTVPAAGLMLTVLKEMSEEPPSDSEVRAIRDEITKRHGLLDPKVPGRSCSAAWPSSPRTFPSIGRRPT